MPTGESLSLSGRTVGQYRIGPLLGRGGMGEVYLATDERLRREVAIKVLPDRLAEDGNARTRFLRESRLACKVVHPYVATVFDVVEYADRPLIVMERIDGLRFDDYVRGEQAGPEEVAALGLEIAEALAAIHRAGIVHRDLKPGNVLVTPEGHVKVTDFGVARSVPQVGEFTTEPADEMDSVTRTGVGVGTVAYMSPEQVRGDKADGRSDLFALGIVLYEAVTGEHPFRRDSLLGTASAILRDPPGGGREHPTLTGSGPIRDVILRLLEKDPDLRYATAEVAAEDLRAVVRGEGLRIAPKLVWRLKRAALAAVAFAAVVAAVVLVPKFLPPGGSGPGGTSNGRPGVLVLPFEGSDADPSNPSRGAMLASLLRAELVQCEGVRVVGSTRTEDLVEQWRSEGAKEGKGEGLGARAAVRYLVSGRFDSRGGAIRLAVDVYDRAQPDHPAAFVVEAESLDSVVDGVFEALRTRVSSSDFAADEPKIALASASESALLAAERARVAAERGDYATASREYSAAVDEDPDFITAHIQRAVVLYRSGHVARATESIAEAEALAAKRARPLPESLALSLVAVRAQVHEKREEEIDARRRLVERFPDDPDERAELAAAYNRANRHSEALAAVDRAVEQRPADRRFHLLLSTILTRIGRLEDARASLQAASAGDSASKDARWRAELALGLGRIEREAKRYEAASASFERARSAASSVGDVGVLAVATQEIAEIRLREGRHAEAIPLLERAAEQLRQLGNVRGNSVVLDTLGATLFQLSRYEEAERHLREGIRQAEATEGLAPRPNVYLNLASLLSYTGRFDESLAFANRAEEAARRQGDRKRVAGAQLQRGVALGALGRYRDSVAAYRSVLDALGAESAEERVGWAWGGIAEGERMRGALGEAIVAADRAIAIQSAIGHPVNAAYAQYGRARLRSFLGDIAGAESDLAAARSKAGDGGSFADLRARLDLEAGLLALERGDRQAAIAKLRAASGGPAAVDLTGFAFAALAEALCEEGRIEAGIEAARRAAESPSSFAERIAARISKAKCLARANRPGDAVAEARAALEQAASAGLAWEQVRAAAVLVGVGADGGPTAEKIDGARDALTRMRESLSDAEARAGFEAKIRDDDAASKVVASSARGRST